jgi:hypothetical protein
VVGDAVGVTSSSIATGDDTQAARINNKIKKNKGCFKLLLLYRELVVWHSFSRIPTNEFYIFPFRASKI